MMMLPVVAVPCPAPVSSGVCHWGFQRCESASFDGIGAANSNVAFSAVVVPRTIPAPVSTLSPAPGFWAFSAGTSTVTAETSAPAPMLETPPITSDALGIADKIWALSQDPNGCLVVQQALEDAKRDDERIRIASELKGNVWDALRSPHANHVLQKCIVTTGPLASQFIIDEILNHEGGAQDAARHRFGCRVVQRLLEHCRKEQVHELVELLVSNGVALSRHAYGNFVMQKVFEQGSADQRHRLGLLLNQHVRTLGGDGNGCAVLEMALQQSSIEDATALAHTMVREKKMFTRMARTRHGHGAVKSAMRLLDGDELEMAHAQLAAEAASLRTSRYGRSSLAALPRSTCPTTVTHAPTVTTTLPIFVAASLASGATFGGA